jgi:hypothetical protein
MINCNLPLWQEADDLASKLRRKGITVPYTGQLGKYNLEEYLGNPVQFREDLW